MGHAVLWELTGDPSFPDKHPAIITKSAIWEIGDTRHADIATEKFSCNVVSRYQNANVLK